MRSDHGLCARTDVSDYPPAILVPYFIYFLQLVGVDPLG
jgi:hypothetical protein